MKKKSKIPWPTKAVMTQIYEEHFWGGENFDFYSGEGSHNPKITKPYIDTLSNFLISNDKNLTVCDLGCGDFNIGKHLVPLTKKYIAIDIVDALIERNTLRYKAKNLEFKCLDISKDELPEADCVILRQVLQHLSNAEILQIIEKIQRYKYIIITEHLPTIKFTANKDKITNLGIRIKKNSGVDLVKSPFNLEVKSSTVLNQVTLEKDNGVIKTTLYIL